MEHRSEYIRRGHEVTRIAFSRLRSAIKAKHGYGAIKRLEADLGFEEGWFRWHARRGATMSLENALACLLWADICPRDFFDDLLSETLSDRETELPSGDVPWIVKNVAVQEAAGQEAAEQESSTARCWSVFFDRLDRLRYDNPLRAIETLTENAPTIPKFHKVELLAVAGSCYRSLYAIPSALHCLWEARRLNQDLWKEGDILQRLIYCLQPTQPQKALRTGRQAQLIFSTLGDPIKVAETLVDQATTLGIMGQIAEAKRMFEAAYHQHGDYLSPRHRVATLQGMAECCLRQGDPTQARDWLMSAHGELRGNADSSNIRAHLLWSLGKIERNLETLSSAVETFGTEHLFEAASATIDYCQLSLEMKLRSKAVTMTATLIKAAIDMGDKVILRMFENLLAQLEMKRVIDWSRQKHMIEGHREQQISSLLPIQPTNS